MNLKEYIRSNPLIPTMMDTIKSNLINQHIEFLFIDFESNTLLNLSEGQNSVFQVAEGPCDFDELIEKYIYEHDRIKVINTYTEFIKNKIQKSTIMFRVRDHLNNTINLRMTLKRIEGGLFAAVIDCTTELKEKKEFQYRRLKNELIYKMSTMSPSDTPRIIQMFLENALIISESKIGYLFHYDPIVGEYNCYGDYNRFLDESISHQTKFPFDSNQMIDSVLKEKQVIICNTPHEMKIDGVLLRYLIIPVLSQDHVTGILVLGNKEDYYTNNDARSIRSLMEEVYRIILMKDNERIASINMEKFQLTFKKAPVGICFMTLEGAYIDVNKKFTEIIGYSESELENMNYVDLTDPEDLDENKLLFAQLIRDEIQEFIYEKRYIKKNGTVIWVKVTCSKVKEEISKEIYLITVVEEITESRLYQQKLKLSEAKLKEAEIISKSGYFEYDVLNDNYYFSEGFIRIFKKEKIVLYNKVIHEKNIQDVMKLFLLSMVNNEIIKNKKKAFHPIHELITTKGEIRYLEFTILPEFANETLTYIRGFAKNITSEKLVEEKLKQNESLYQTVIENLPYKFIIKDTTLNFIASNSLYAESLNTSKEALIGKNDFDFYPEDYAIQNRLNDLRVLEHKKTEDWEQQNQINGIEVWESIIKSVVMDKQGHTVALVTMIKDITEKKANDFELENYRNKLEELVSEKSNELVRIEEEVDLFFHTTLDMLCISTLEGFFKKLSKTWSKNFEWTEEELLNLPVIEFIHPDDKHKTLEMMNRLKQGQDVVNFINRFLCKDQTYRWIDWNSTPIVERGIIISAARDITKQKEVELALIEEKQKAEMANKAKSEFLANISHEIRTPLNSVIGYAELLESHLMESNLIHYVKGINSSGRMLLSLINDILDLSKIESSKMTFKYDWIKLKEFIDNIEKIFIYSADEKNITFKVELDENLPNYVFIDEIRLRQVLVNLIGNGIKFTQKGYVALKISGFMDDGLSLIFKVEDTGIGIEASELSSIFDAFTQQKSIDRLKYGGTGLGLTICKKLVNSMNGEIIVESQLNYGSTFQVILRNIEYKDLSFSDTTWINQQEIIQVLSQNMELAQQMIQLLSKTTNALKMKLTKQIANTLIESGTTQHSDTLERIGRELLNAINEVQLEKCNMIIKELKKILLKDGMNNE